MYMHNGDRTPIIPCSWRTQDKFLALGYLCNVRLLQRLEHYLKGITLAIS